MTATRQFDLSAAILIIMVLTLAVFAMLWGVLDGPATVLTDRGTNATSADVQQGATWISLAWTYAPAAVLVAASMRLISRALFESRGGAR